MFRKTMRTPTAALHAALLLAAGIATLPASAEDCVVKLGAVGPMSGGAAAWGLSAKAGAEFAAAQVNEEGGLEVGGKKCKVGVVSFDSQYTAAGGAAASNYLASEGVHITVGPVGSPETTGFRPVAKRNGQINFSSSYMRDVISPEFPLAFHALQAPVTWGPILIQEAKAEFKFKSVLITAPNDQGGTDSGKQLLKLYSDAGVSASTEYYQRGTTNFAPLTARVMTLNPDAVEMSSVPPADATVLTKSLLEVAYCVVPGPPKCGIQPLLRPAMGLQGRTLWRGRDRSPNFSRRFPTRRAARPSCSNVAGRMDSFVPLAATPARPR